MTERRKSIDQLWSLLPLVYRERDRRNDAPDVDHLRLYLEACGDLLDRVRETLEQRHADAFAQLDQPPGGRRVQEWLLPYLARLLDARLLSPHVDGRRAEVANAIGWRQRKGTRVCVEDIAETVGQLEVEIQEGWQRVAVTPRVDKPLLRDPDLDDQNRLGEHGHLENPLDGPRHRHLPVTTVDTRFADRAVQASATDPFVHESRYDGAAVTWRARHPHGVPCFPGTYEDASVRTVDVRTPDWRVGHVHPRNLLLFVPPPYGFFRPATPEEPTTVDWDDVKSAPGTDHTFYAPDVAGRRTLYSRGAFELVDEHAVPLPARARYTVRIRDAAEISDAAFPDDDTPPPEVIAGLCFDGFLKLRGRALELRSVAASTVELDEADGVAADLTAIGCLVETLEAVKAEIQLEYCTVLNKATAMRLNASDCIFAGALTVEKPNASCVRYSRIPAAFDAGRTNTADEPVFHAYETCAGNGSAPGSYGAPGCGVLHPRAPESVRHGAEDGGEMGAYHERRYCLADEAIIDKLTDYLPLGIVAVLIPDARLHVEPPEEKESLEP
ncbi:MAG: hypothetical protein GY715_04005 [Planctomycetes bacterium]|nr:hypothetical protein [Planctomycetota bacterium]